MPEARQYVYFDDMAQLEVAERRLAIATTALQLVVELLQEPEPRVTQAWQDAAWALEQLEES